MTAPTPRDNIAGHWCGQTQPHASHVWQTPPVYGTATLIQTYQCGGCADSPVLDALVAERVAALAEDPAMVAVVRRELMGPGLPHPQAERIIRALAAALTERRPDA